MSSSKVADRLAQEAGITTSFPGPTENESRYLRPSKIDAQQAKHAHSINNEALKMHYLRNKKFEEPEKYLKINGNSENRVRFTPHEKSLYYKKAVTRADNEVSLIRGPFIQVSTEYTDRYNPIVKLKKNADDATPPFIVNPHPNMLGASMNRPYDNGIIRPEDVKGLSKSSYQFAHKWPESGEIDKFPWIKPL